MARPKDTHNTEPASYESPVVFRETAEGKAEIKAYALGKNRTQADIMRSAWRHYVKYCPVRQH